MQLALLVVAFDGTAEMHAALVQLLAAGTGIEVDVGFTVLGHARSPEQVSGEPSIEALGDAMRTSR